MPLKVLSSYDFPIKNQISLVKVASIASGQN